LIRTAGSAPRTLPSPYSATRSPLGVDVILAVGAGLTGDTEEELHAALGELLGLTRAS
jgi:hypothetical protein